MAETDGKFLDYAGLSHFVSKLKSNFLDKKVDKETGKALSTNDFTDALKTKLEGVEAGAEVNQNAFSALSVPGQDSLVADAKTDKLIFTGENITLTTTQTASGDDELDFKVNIASGTNLGLAKQGENVTVDANGAINVATAHGTTLGVCKQGENVTVDATGAINVATSDGSKLGVVKKGANVNIDVNGAVSVGLIGKEAFGVAEAGENIEANSGVISVKNASISQKGVVMLSNDTGSTSTVVASTPYALTMVANAKADKAATLAGYGILDAYTKSEIDAKLGSAFTYKGSFATFQSLLDAVDAGTYVPAKGDVWNIRTAGGTDETGVAIKEGDNVAYSGTGWDVLAGTTDLTNYVTKSDVLTDAEIDAAIAAV